MIASVGLVALAIGQAAAFPWVVEMPGVDSSLLGRSVKRQTPGSAATCPNNPNHTPAVPISAKYPYCGAIGGAPGFQVCINNKVPADGDKAHQYVAPGKNDIRGPCPGLNTAANHNFLAHDGITTFAELVDAQQNVYGVGWDLAVLLAVLGVGLDGDPVTTKLSLGCDATSRTSLAGNGPELGLDGHNKFEGDSSLTRNDYFTAGGDNFSFNRTLYDRMLKVCNGNCNREAMGAYRYQRYQESLNENGNFYFGPKSLLLFGASSFLYELFPSLGDLGVADKAQMDSFFLQERIPDNWFSRVTPYTIPDVAFEIFAQYELGPVAFGGNTGKPNSFVGVGQYGPYISGNKFQGTPEGVACLLYQVATENIPASIGGGSTQVPDANLQWMRKQLNPVYQSANLSSFGCPLNFNGA